MIEIGIRIDKGDLLDVAKAYAVNPDVLEAIMLTETSGEGYYLNTNKPKIRFENHWFDKLTKGKYKDSHPHITIPFWVKNYNKQGLEEIGRFDEAFELDEVAACLSTSWGIGQVMGFNYAKCGFADVFEFVKAMFISEKLQFGAMMEYIKNTPKLLPALQTEDMDTFFKGYNGDDYKQYEYDIKFYRHLNRLRNAKH